MYYFIVNPNSRSGRGRSIWNEIHQQLMLRGIDFQYCLTRYSGHAAEIASDACALGTESEPVYIIAVGGDGTGIYPKGRAYQQNGCSLPAPQ